MAAKVTKKYGLSAIRQGLPIWFGCLIVIAVLIVMGLGRFATQEQAQEIRIVAFGTSNTYGKFVAREETYPAKLERALKTLGYSVVVRNEGVNGDTTGGMLSRLNAAVPPGTHIVLVEPGYNDARRGVSDAEVRANLQKIVARLRARKIEVILFGIPKNAVSDIAYQHNALFRPPIRYGFTAGVGKTLPAYAASDRFHLSAKAYGIVVSNIMPDVKLLIDRVQKRKR